jgi:hypothetical protein
VSGNYAPTRTDYGTGDRRWLPNLLKADTHGIVLDGDLFPAGVIKSGTHIGRVTSSKLGGPFNGTTEEVQSVTEGGSGLTSFTLTFSGQTTGAIPAAATAAQVQAALEALSNIGVGDVAVTGAASGPFTVTFGGALANTNVAQMTATPTGGSGTVTVATVTAGGSAVDSPAGLGKSEGLLLNDTKIAAGQKIHVAIVHGGTVDRRFLPDANHDTSAEADLTAIAFIN